MSRPPAFTGGSYDPRTEDLTPPDYDERASPVLRNGKIPNEYVSKPDFRVRMEDEFHSPNNHRLSQGSGDYNYVSDEATDIPPDYLHPVPEHQDEENYGEGRDNLGYVPPDYLHPVPEQPRSDHGRGSDNVEYMPRNYLEPVPMQPDYRQGTENLGYVSSPNDQHGVRRRNIPNGTVSSAGLSPESVETFVPYDTDLDARGWDNTRAGSVDLKYDPPQDYEAVDETNLPSTHVHPKAKTLTDRLQEVRLQGTNAAAKTLRDSMWDIDTSLRGTAWKRWEKWKSETKAAWNSVEVWSSHFKEIEGKFGSATVSYFRFTRWLVYLNLFGFLMSFLVIVVPFFSTTHPESFSLWLSTSNLCNRTASNSNDTCPYQLQAKQCSEAYMDYVKNSTDKKNVGDKIVDFIVGTGWLETTILFYGNYYNRTFETSGTKHFYNMGLAYLLALGFTFLLSLIFIILNSSRSVREGVIMESETFTTFFTNSVFCGWDYSIVSENSAAVRKKILFQELKAALEEQRKRLTQMNRSKRDLARLYAVRLAVNVIILCILAASLFLVYYTMTNLIKLQKQSLSEELSLVVQYLPSVTITILNVIIPLLFAKLVSYEDYWPVTEMRMTLFRTVVLRLASLGVLVVTLYYSLHVEEQKVDKSCPEEVSGEQGKKCCGNNLWFGHNSTKEGSVKCWETYVGQQFYKLTLLDFAVYIVYTFLVEFPRKSIYKHLKGKIDLVANYGSQEFDIPQNVLDLVYSQTLSWCGMFFTPLLPGISFVKCLIIFFIKKVSLMNNYEPPQKAYNASKANSFFMTILLLSFIATSAVIGYMIGNIHPSKSCGPFRVYSNENYTVWKALIDEILSWPRGVANFLFFLATPAFFIPAFGVLCFVIYCYWTIGQGYKKMQEMLSDHLKMEGRDKHFLLARVDELQKRHKQLEIPESLKQSTSIKGKLLLSPNQPIDQWPGNS